MATSAAAAAAVAQAVKASGTIVQLEPAEFQRVLYNGRDLVVVLCEPRRFKSKYEYLTSYRGLAFYTASPGAIPLPSGCELITARKIWMP